MTLEQTTPTPETPKPATPAAPGKPATTPLVPPKPAMKPPQSSMAAAVNSAIGKRLTVPKSLTLGNTNDKHGMYFHCCIYGDTDSRKTTTAAQFGSPEDVRIILTRRREQLTPLRDMNYQYAEVTDEAALTFALQYPEQLWPDWAARPNRTLVLDDATEAIAQLLEGAEGTLEEASGGREVKDPRRTFREAGDTLRDVMKVTLRKPQHFIMTALETVKEHPISGGDRVVPNLPPSMMNLITTEMEFVFYINKGVWQFTTQPNRIQVTQELQDGKKKTFSREVFAKQKLPKGLSGKNVILASEKMDLAAIWQKVLEGKSPLEKK